MVLITAHNLGAHEFESGPRESKEPGVAEFVREVGQRSENCVQNDQREGRNCRHLALLPAAIQETPVPDSGRRIL
jgi:hypothetical protein